MSEVTSTGSTASTDTKIKIIPFEQFGQLINDVAKIVNKITELYNTAQHNKKITKILMDRIAAANFVVSLLRDDSRSDTSSHYANLQSLVEVLQKMKTYSEEITQYSTLLKFLKTKSIESQFNELCQEYDASVDSLRLSLMVNFEANAVRDSEILKKEIEDLSKFQEALLESMNTSDKTFMNDIIKQVSEMSITMQSIESLSRNDEAAQKKIDDIFKESPLSFKEYKEYKGPDTTRGEGEKKFSSKVKPELDFAFRTIDKELINQVKNQVTILKKIKDCQNVIHFYGFTKYGEDKYYLITEWAENGNLFEFIKERGQNIKIEQRLKFAYDIAKGLNFLNSVKIPHRDIRSENIVIIDQNAKITNFKLSKGFEGATGNLAVNKESVRHNSPETLRRGMSGTDKDRKKRYDTKSEVYSFGILLWEIAECKIAYSKFEDFMEITNKVINGYREPFTVTGIPEKYQDLVNEAVDQNPGYRPTFAKMLVCLQDIFKNYKQSASHSIKENNVDFSTFNTMTIDRAVEEHKKSSTKRNILYGYFKKYADMGNPKAKYWKAYYITKGWSDLPSSSKEKNLKTATDLFKEAADYGDEFPEAQLRYALSVMSQNKEEAIEYLLKAAKNEHIVAMFNVATYYFSKNSNDELGKRYMIMAANKNYLEAINYCKEKNIPY